MAKILEHRDAGQDHEVACVRQPSEQHFLEDQLGTRLQLYPDFYPTADGPQMTAPD